MDRSQLVLERFRSYGLTDCLMERSSGPGPEAAMCTCRMGRACRHTRTFFRPDRPDVPYQDDYLFASRPLVQGKRLLSCTALPVDANSPSDHAPIIAMFDVPGSDGRRDRKR